METKRIIKEYCEQLYAHKFDNLDEIDKFLERHNFPKLTQKERDNLNRAISVKESVLTTNNLPKQKAAGPDGFIDEFKQTFNEEIILIL